MENRIKILKTDKELTDYVLSCVDSDIRTNKSISNTDFSTFLSTFLGFCTGKQYRKGFEEMQTRILFGLCHVEEKLKEYIQKPVYFSDSKEAAFAIMKILDSSELNRIDEYAIKIGTSSFNKDCEINSKALKYFYQGYNFQDY
jgi:hypothetical protein